MTHISSFTPLFADLIDALDDLVDRCVKLPTLIVAKTNGVSTEEYAW